MHRSDEPLLNVRQLYVGLVAALTLHAGRDAADDDDDVHVLHLAGEFIERDGLALTDVAA